MNKKVLLILGCFPLLFIILYFSLNKEEPKEIPVQKVETLKIEDLPGDKKEDPVPEPEKEPIHSFKDIDDLLKQWGPHWDAKKYPAGFLEAYHQFLIDNEENLKDWQIYERYFYLITAYNQQLKDSDKELEIFPYYMKWSTKANGEEYAAERAEVQLSHARSRFNEMYYIDYIYKHYKNHKDVYQYARFKEGLILIKDKDYKAALEMFNQNLKDFSVGDEYYFASLMRAAEMYVRFKQAPVALSMLESHREKIIDFESNQELLYELADLYNNKNLEIYNIVKAVKIYKQIIAICKTKTDPYDRNSSTMAKVHMKEIQKEIIK
ncbi:MAG: hypothetical protein HRT89_04415 [Lentisphaeria bacterium]|nr:hypothetical protein [Lentisphaeria bacterium]